MDAIRLLKLVPTTLVIYLTLLESHYSSSNPYHNNVHAADVTQSVNVLLRRPALQVVLPLYTRTVCEATYLTELLWHWGVARHRPSIQHFAALDCTP